MAVRIRSSQNGGVITYFLFSFLPYGEYLSTYFGGFFLFKSDHHRLVFTNQIRAVARIASVVYKNTTDCENMVSFVNKLYSQEIYLLRTTALIWIANVNILRTFRCQNTLFKNCLNTPHMVAKRWKRPFVIAESRDRSHGNEMYKNVAHGQY